MIYIPSTLTRLDTFSVFTTVPEFLTKKECLRIRNEMPLHKLQEAKVTENGTSDGTIRTTLVGALDFTDKTHWVFQKLFEAVNQINAQYYRYDIVGFQEAVQLMQYDVGSHYDWHIDYGNQHHSQRKLSLSIQLSDPSEYEGGDLEFFKNGNASKAQGALILFPSFMFHKVHPVTSGVRRALVGWISGNSFK